MIEEILKTLDYISLTGYILLHYSCSIFSREFYVNRPSTLAQAVTHLTSIQELPSSILAGTPTPFTKVFFTFSHSVPENGE